MTGSKKHQPEGCFNAAQKMARYVSQWEKNQCAQHNQLNNIAN
jgi:hypothetical protein